MSSQSISKKSSTYDALFLVTGRVLQLFYSFLAIKLLTNIMPVKEVGNYYLLISLIGFFTMILISPAGSYHTKNINDLNDNGLLFSSLFLLTIFIVVTFIISIPLLYLYLYYSELNNLSFPIVLAVISLDLIFGTLSSVVIGAFNMTFHRIRFILYTNIVLFSGLLFALILTRYISATAYYWLIGIMSAKLIICIFVLIDLKKTLLCKVNLKYIKSSLTSKVKLFKAARFCFPLSIAAIAVWIQTYYYRFYTNEYFSLEILAMISLGFAMATNLTLAFESVVNQYFIPLLYKRVASESEDKSMIYMSFFNSIIPLYLAFFVFLAYFSPLVISIITNEQYVNAGNYMIWGIAIEFIRVITRLFSHTLYIESETKSIMISSFIGGAIVIIVLSITTNLVADNIMLIPACLLASSFTSFIVVFIKIRKLITFQIEFIKWVLVIFFSSLLFLFHLVPVNGFAFEIFTVVIGAIYFCTLQYLFNKTIFML